MKKNILFTSILFCLLTTIFVLREKDYLVKESITFFPIDKTLDFSNANTTLTLLNQKKHQNNYSLIWQVYSNLGKESYLRQDVSFLFKNGRLIGKIGDWKENADKLMQRKEIDGMESSLFQAITFHYAEIHRDNKIFSVQLMSGDELYVIDSQFSPLQSFRIAKTKEQKEWGQFLTDNIKKQLNYDWEDIIQYYSINKENYQSFPLTDIISFQLEPLNGFSMEQTEQIIGNLWEGLYKNYFLGIKTKNGTLVDPTYSTVPLILLANDHSHLLILFSTSEGEPIMLRQKIPVTY